MKTFYKIWAEVERIDREEDGEEEYERASEPIELRTFDTYKGAISYLEAIGAAVYESDYKEARDD